MPIELQRVDSREWVKSNPQMFFRAGRVDAIQLAAWLMDTPHAARLSER
jgi:hypothetical protein